MSDIMGTSSSKKIKAFQLPNLAGDFKPIKSEAYIFTPFGDQAEQASMTLADAEEKAAEIVKAAQKQADGLLKKANDQAQALKKEAEKIRAEAADTGFAQGLAQGKTEGRDQAQKDFEAKVEPTVDAMMKVENLYQNLWASNEAVMVKLAIKIAERVLFQELSTSPEVVSATFKAALDHLHEQHQVTFRAHPEDLAHLETVRNELRDSIQGLVKISFEPDATLARGDLIMETDAGRLDATLRGRLASVTTVVDEVLRHNFDLDW